MPRRTNLEITSDLTKIKIVAHSCTNFSQIEARTGLSRSQINTTLSFYPGVKERIQLIFQENLNNDEKMKIITAKFDSNQSKAHPYRYETSSLSVAKKVGKALRIRKLESYNQSIVVLSKGVEYRTGPVDLKLGDDVLIATRKPGDIFTFLHFRILNISQKNNSKMIYKRTIHTKELFYIPQKYRRFVDEFIAKISE